MRRVRSLYLRKRDESVYALSVPAFGAAMLTPSSTLYLSLLVKMGGEPTPCNMCTESKAVPVYLSEAVQQGRVSFGYLCTGDVSGLHPAWLTRSLTSVPGGMLVLRHVDGSVAGGLVDVLTFLAAGLRGDLEVLGPALPRLGLDACPDLPTGSSSDSGR